MTVKSQCELDSRIKSIEDVQTCLHYDDKYIGEDGYFATDLSELSDLSGCLHSTLAQIIAEGAGDDIFRTPYDVDCDQWGTRFFVPDSLLKPIEKTYRPFTLDEWKEVIKDNYQWITMRVKGTNQEFSLMYTGFVTTTKGSYISLGSHEFDFKCLADNYEIFVNNQWQPFGIEVEE